MWTVVAEVWGVGLVHWPGAQDASSFVPVHSATGQAGPVGTESGSCCTDWITHLAKGGGGHLFLEWVF